MKPAGLTENNITPLRENATFVRVREWAGLLTRFLSLEILIQAMSFAAGILIVRALPKAEYAWFTIANTMQQTMNTLADNGISSGLTAIGGRVWNDRSRFGQLLRTAMRLRRVFALLAMLVVMPFLAWLLLGAGAKPAYTTVLCAAVLIGLYFQLTIGVLIVAPRLHYEVRRVQNMNFWSAALRLALILGAYALFLDPLVAIIAGTICFAFQEWLLRRWLSSYVEKDTPPNPAYRREILGIVKHQAPNSIYYCVQSQLMIWLISIFGSASNVAEVGALGRIAMIFTMLGSLMMNVVEPRFARVQEPRLLFRRYWQILAGVGVVSGALLLVTALFPRALLWILGPQYAHLEAELFLMILGAVLGWILGVMYQLNVTKGWIVSPWLLIPIGVVTEAILIILLDLSQVRNVLLMGIYATFPGFLLNYWRTRRGLREAARSVGEEGNS